MGTKEHHKTTKIAPPKNALQGTMISYVVANADIMFMPFAKSLLFRQSLLKSKKELVLRKQTNIYFKFSSVWNWLSSKVNIM